jgi:hypothetical protein
MPYNPASLKGWNKILFSYLCHAVSVVGNFGEPFFFDVAGFQFGYLSGEMQGAEHC